MKVCLLFGILFAILGCENKKTFKIGNDYRPDYRVGDTLIFMNANLELAKYFCKSSLYYMEVDKTSEHTYTYEKFRAYANATKPDREITVYINYYSLDIWVPYFQNLNSYRLYWPAFKANDIHTDTILGNVYQHVVEIENFYKDLILKYDLYKGVLSYADTSGNIWQLKEIKR